MTAAALLRSLIERLCTAQEFVCEHLLGYDHPNDCICGRGGFWREGRWPHDFDRSYHWLSSGRAVDYIVNAAKFCALSKVPPELLAKVVKKLEAEAGIDPPPQPKETTP